ATDVADFAIEHARKIGYDTVIVDTAGRLHIDGEMMREVADIAESIKPQRVLYVADAMTGQDAVKSAKAFDEALPVTGVVLTKLDGDARGGAALSVRAVTGKPILFAGTGERLEDLEAFHPERMASRILGMGDVVSLVESVSSSMGEGEAREMGEAIFKKNFTLEDFLKQIKMMKRLGPMEKIVGMLPGVGGHLKDMKPDDIEREIRLKEAIVLSMTSQERANPRILNGSRRKRIAAGAGREVSDVNRFIKEFEAMERMMKKFSGGGKMKKLLKGLTTQAFS
ncbi:MAG TPA: signal recognition particle protein, partial [bacterium]|nr:signal recognition particle protein [bacterium]